MHPVFSGYAAKGVIKGKILYSLLHQSNTGWAATQHFNNSVMIRLDNLPLDLKDLAVFIV